jgi:uncharacterized membrane protein YkvA (DUF1232 family)
MHFFSFNNLRQKALSIKRDMMTVYYAIKDPRTPWYAKVVAALVVGYALSPIDLIPDFIPVLGYLDDIILVPLGILITIRLIPPAVIADCRAKVDHEFDGKKPKSWIGAAIIIILWIFAAFWIGTFLFQLINR